MTQLTLQAQPAKTMQTYRTLYVPYCIAGMGRGRSIEILTKLYLPDDYDGGARIISAGAGQQEIEARLREHRKSPPTVVAEALQAMGATIEYRDPYFLAGSEMQREFAKAEQVIFLAADRIARQAGLQFINSIASQGYKAGIEEHLAGDFAGLAGFEVADVPAELRRDMKETRRMVTECSAISARLADIIRRN